MGKGKKNTESSGFLKKVSMLIFNIYFKINLIFGYWPEDMIRKYMQLLEI